MCFLRIKLGSRRNTQEIYSNKKESSGIRKKSKINHRYKKWMIKQQEAVRKCKLAKLVLPNESSQSQEHSQSFYQYSAILTFFRSYHIITSNRI